MPVFAARRRSYLFMLNKLRLPRPLATRLVKGSVIALSPSTQRERRIGVRPLKAALAIGEDKGYRLYSPDELPGTRAAVAALAALFDKAKASGDLSRQAQSKPFLISAVPQLDLLRDPAVRDFVLSDVMADTAIRYFGEVPILTELSLYWSPPNETMAKSQLYHFDAEDYRQLKVFLNVFEVTPDCGPLTLMPAGVSRRIGATSHYAGGRRTRLADEAVSQEAAPGEEIKVTGPPGAGIFVDTSRCLHYGSRGNRRERLVMMIQFMSINAPKIEPAEWTPLAKELGPLDAARKLILQV